MKYILLVMLGLALIGVLGWLVWLALPWMLDLPSSLVDQEASDLSYHNT